jgi:hypothetical protein
MILTSLTLAALFQLAVPNSGNALVAYPTLGYALSAGHLVRLAGIPGACYAMPDLSTTLYTQFQSASASRAILLFSGGDSPALLYRTPLNDTTVVLPDSPIEIAISPTGAYFAVLSPSHLWLYRRSASAAIATIDVHSLPILVADVTAILVGDNGDLVLNTPTALWYSANPADPASAFSMISVATTFLRFAPRDRLLVGYEPAQGRVIALHPSNGFAIEPLITPKDSLAPVTGLEFGAAPLSIWVSQQNGNLLNYDLSQRQETSHIVPAGAIVSVVAPGVFLWSQLDQSTIILDTTRTTPTVLTVPVVSPAVSQ